MAGWLAALEAPERADRLAACEVLVARASDDPIVAARLRARLAAGSAEARFAAAFALFRIAPDAGLIEPLIEALGLADGDARWQAAQMLVGLGRREPAVLPALVELARDGALAMRRRMALFALRDLAPGRAEAVTAMLAGLGDPDARVRRAALACMGRLERPAPGALEAALDAARAHADPRMRRIAVAVLPALARRIPGAAARVRPLLETLRGADDPSLARAAEGSLQQLAPGDGGR